MHAHIHLANIVIVICAILDISLQIDTNGGIVVCNCGHKAVN